MATAWFPGCAWAPADLIVQCMHDVCRLFSGLEEIDRGGGGGGDELCTLLIRRLYMYSMLD